MKIVVAVLSVIMMGFTAQGAALTVTDSTDARVGIFHQLKCNAEMACSKDSSNRFLLGVSGVQTQVVASATTITKAQCGSTFINAGAIQMELPEASAVLGCRLTFITGNASNFDVNPDDADQILVQTNAAGDAMRNATLGNSITIEAISATQWAPVAVVGTWSDIN